MYDVYHIDCYCKFAISDIFPWLFIYFVGNLKGRAFLHVKYKAKLKKKDNNRMKIISKFDLKRAIFFLILPFQIVFYHSIICEMWVGDQQLYS